VGPITREGCHKPQPTPPPSLTATWAPPWPFFSLLKSRRRALATPDPDQPAQPAELTAPLPLPLAPSPLPHFHSLYQWRKLPPLLVLKPSATSPSPRRPLLFPSPSIKRQSSPLPLPCRARPHLPLPSHRRCPIPSRAHAGARRTIRVEPHRPAHAELLPRRSGAHAVVSRPFPASCPHASSFVQG
jgi:hypothetical protein